jgi:ribosomal protein S18 acetylase RimI-like enzyme
LLEGAGYEAVRTVYVMSIELDDPPPAPVFPEGLSVREFVPGQDERAVFDTAEDAFRDHWGRPPGTFGRFLNLTREPSWNPALWHLAEDDEGVQAVCLSKIVAGEGHIDSVGVRRTWRRRGVGLALLHLAFGALYERGVRKIDLSVDAESATGAPRVYGRAGMQVSQSYTVYEKELRAGRDLAVQS